MGGHKPALSPSSSHPGDPLPTRAPHGQKAQRRAEQVHAPMDQMQGQVWATVHLLSSINWGFFQSQKKEKEHLPGGMSPVSPPLPQGPPHPPVGHPLPGWTPDCHPSATAALELGSLWHYTPVSPAHSSSP